MSSSVNQELVNLLQNGKHIIVTSTGQSAGANNGKTTIHPDGIIVSTGIQGISDVSLTGSATAAGITDTQAVFKIPETSPAPTKTSVAISQQNGQFVAPPGCIGILMPNGSIHNSSLTLVTPQGTGVTQNANSGIQMILTDSPNAGKTTSTLFQSSELPTFSNYLTQTTNTCTSESEGAEKHSMLHTLLTTGTCPMEPLLIRRSSATGPISPDTVDTHSELSSPLGQPTSIFDSNTQQTLICKSENLNLGQSDGQEDDVNDIKWDVIDSEEPNKALKSHRNSDAPSSILEQETMEKLFDAGSAVSTSEFTFTKFGADVPGLFTFGENKKPNVCTSTNTVGTVSSSVIVPHEMEEDMFEVPVKTHTRSQSTKHKVKEPSLNQQFPVRVPGYELQILEQPEEQHRARYLTEGSRGAVKNRAGDGYALVQLSGDVDYATLQVFVGNDTGRVKPHGFYQACKVSGKNSTPCKEKEVDGTMVIEMELSAMNDMKASIDNVGILKLRNADVEQRIGIAKAKKKSTKARMIFRVIFQKADGNLQTLQIASSPILCTQPIGQPEMCKISMDSCSAEGGLELFIIGKNFLKGTKVIFQEVDQEDEKTVIWRKDSEIDKDYFQPTHLICTVPPYQDPNIESNKKVQLITNSGGKMSDPLSFTYTPGKKFGSKIYVFKMIRMASPNSLLFMYHSPAVNEISSNHQLTSNHQIYNSTNTGVQGSALQQGATDQKVFHPSSPLDSASVKQTSINANTQQVHFQDTTSAYSDNGVNLSQLLNDGNTDQIQSFTGNNSQYQPNTNTQYQSNTSQQYQANTSQQFQLNNQMNNAQQYQSNATEQYQSNANQQFQTNAGQQFQTNTNQQYQANTSQQFQANTGTQFSLNSTQQYQDGQTTQPQYPEGGSTGGTQLSGLQSQQLPMIQQGQSSTQQFTPELISDYNNHVSPNVTASEGMHSVSSQQNMAFNTETKLDVMEQKTSGFQVNDQSLSFQTTGGVANCHPPSVQFHISDNPGPTTSFPTLSQTSETTQQSNQFDNDVKMYQQASPLQTTNSQNNYQQQQQQQQQLQQQSSALPNHPKFQAAPEAQMLAAQFIQNATKGTETLVNQPQTTMVHSNLLQSNTTQSQSDGYHSNSPANQQSLQSLISELTSQNGLTTPLTNSASPQQQFANTPSQPSAPQIIICNPPGNSGNSGQQAPPPTSVPSSTGMPSIVILPGGGNSTTQVESLLRSILGSLNQQQNS
uniref:NFAT protein n=1 Tax=Pinctada fucata TaxID=50426 RepID=A0A097P8M0_PINFU|nr:NFAT protein [Pinctada fucata]